MKSAQLGQQLNRDYWEASQINRFPSNLHVFHYSPFVCLCIADNLQELDWWADNQQSYGVLWIFRQVICTSNNKLVSWTSDNDVKGILHNFRHHTHAHSLATIRDNHSAGLVWTDHMGILSLVSFHYCHFVGVWWVELVAINTTH